MDAGPPWRQADAANLGLALMALRNLSLRRLDPAQAPAAWWAGHAAWWQEYWIGRHLQRGRGPAAALRGTRLASILPQADDWFGADAAPVFAPRAAVASAAGPIDDSPLRAYLADTFETVQDLLASAAPGDTGLHFFRAALWHEARCAEALAEACAAAQCPLPGGEPQAPPPRPARLPLYLPAQTCVLGHAPDAAGWCPPLEAGQLTLAKVPEFEIDAQAVNWAQFSEFAQDGGYDEPRWWTSAGWQWLQGSGQRAPQGVEQMRDAVVAQRFGRSQRLPAQAAVMHVSLHEAQAWCVWAGRRLPTEAEWQIAAQQGAGRGFLWGDVWEWTLSPARPYSPAAAAPSPGFATWPDAAHHGVLRGASWLTPQALVHTQARRLWPIDASQAFVGFRSCSL